MAVDMVTREKTEPITAQGGDNEDVDDDNDGFVSLSLSSIEATVPLPRAARADADAVVMDVEVDVVVMSIICSTAARWAGLRRIAATMGVSAYHDPPRMGEARPGRLAGG